MRLLLFNLATDADDPILGFTTRWIVALAKRVEIIYVITMRAGRIAVPVNVQVYSLGKEKGYSEPRRAIEFYRRLFQVLRKDHIDACFSHMAPIFTVLAAPVLKARGIPIVTWYAHPSLNWVLRLAHRLSDRMVASIATAYPYRRDKLIAVGQGIDMKLFSPDHTVPQETPPLILCVGRLSPVKDHPTLINAVGLLRQRWGKPFRSIILGGTASPKDELYARSLRKQVRELGLQDAVYFEPAVPCNTLPSWYRRCTVHVNLTPTGFGDKVAWEAMSSGKPCLVANEGFRDTLGKYTAFLLFNHANPQELAHKLQFVLTLSESERVRIGAYLRDRVILKHSLTRLVEQLFSLFLSTKPLLTRS